MKPLGLSPEDAGLRRRSSDSLQFNRSPYSLGVLHAAGSQTSSIADSAVLRRNPGRAIGYGSAHDRAVTAADRRRQGLGRQRLDAGQRRAGADDDRPRPGALLRRPGAQEERARHHDAELRHDGADHRALGDRRLQPVLRVRQQLHRRLASTLFCTASAPRPIPTTPPPSRSRPS